MIRSGRLVLGWTFCSLIVALGRPGRSEAQDWAGYAQNAQHTAVSTVGSQLPNKIRWSTPVDLHPQYVYGGDLLTHFGSPLITRANTVLVPVKTGATDGFRVDARRGSDGHQLWSMVTDYTLPPHNWIPPMGPTLSAKDTRLVVPAAGGTVLVRAYPDSAKGPVSRVAFYDPQDQHGYFAANQAALTAGIKICTPITADTKGNIYFGIWRDTGVTLPDALNYPSGVVRISPAGLVKTVSAAAICSNALGRPKIAYNCAPALSNDGTKLYVAANDASSGDGYLCCLDAATLNPVSNVYLLDPRSTPSGVMPALVSDDGTSTPTIGPDGDVYYGVLEWHIPSNHDRGWMLHFDAGLMTTKTPGAFGWDDSASIVAASLVASYKGGSSYLLLTKYNNYADGGIGGDGLNKVAILDPGATMRDPITGATVMAEVITVLGATANTGLAGVREWCINTAAIDPINKCAVINSEDGRVYRWDFTTNTLSPGLYLAPPTGEAYTSTLIGPDGAIYAINNGTLFSCTAK